MTKKLKIEALMNEDQLAFTIHKSKSMSLVEILGALEVISSEVEKSLKEKLRIQRT